MKKFFTSKTFLVSLLAILCIGIAAVCLILSMEKPSNFTPDPVESQSVDDWQENASTVNPNDWGSAADGNSSDKSTGQYPKVVEENDDDVVVDFTPPQSPEDAEPPAIPDGKTEIKNPTPEHTPNIDPEVTAPEPEKPVSNDPTPGSTNGSGEFYDPVFGWVKPGTVNQQGIDSDGDPNKMVGNMG